MLLSLSKQPTAVPNVAECMEKSAESKLNIIICLRNAVLAKTREIVNEDSKSAKEL